MQNNIFSNKKEQKKQERDEISFLLCVGVDQFSRDVAVQVS